MIKIFRMLLLAAVILQGCKPKQNIVYMGNHNFEEEVGKAVYQGVHIQEGDVLDISISAFDDIAVKPFNKSSMQTTSSAASTTATSSGNEYVVSSEGSITLPVLGDIYCKGMTKLQLKQDIENRLKKYLTDPMVTVLHKNFNISILGEVRNPGQKISATEKLNIFQALALAGDITDDGNRTNVKLIRASEDGTAADTTVVLDLSDASIARSPYYYLQQNDIIYVEPDQNKQVALNSNASVDKILKYGGVGLGVLTLIITLITRK